LGAKTDRNYIFISHDPHIGSVIHNGPLYKFSQVLKNIKFPLKSIDFTYNFTEYRQFGAKTDRNSIFISHDPDIVDLLYIIAPYMIFYGFKKN
jgi:uncharacterized membrane protein YwaF